MKFIKFKAYTKDPLSKISHIQICTPPCGRKRRSYLAAIIPDAAWVSSYQNKPSKNALILADLAEPPCTIPLTSVSRMPAASPRSQTYVHPVMRYALSNKACPAEVKPLSRPNSHTSMPRPYSKAVELPPAKRSAQRPTKRSTLVAAVLKKDLKLSDFPRAYLQPRSLRDIVTPHA